MDCSDLLFIPPFSKENKPWFFWTMVRIRCPEASHFPGHLTLSLPQGTQYLSPSSCQDWGQHLNGARAEPENNTHCYAWWLLDFSFKIYACDTLTSRQSTTDTFHSHKLLHFGELNQDRTYTVNGKGLESVVEQRKLGVQLYSYMKVQTQVDRVAQKAFGTFAFIDPSLDHRGWDIICNCTGHCETTFRVLCAVLDTQLQWD